MNVTIESATKIASTVRPAALTVLLLSTVVLTGCQSSPFKRQPVVEPRYIPNLILGEAQVLTIMPGRVSCDSTRPMQCVIARQQSDAVVFQIPYDWIDGLTPTASVEYMIEARPQIDANKGAPTGHWTLTQMISQQPVGYL